jgi:hypothetical protein
VLGGRQSYPASAVDRGGVVIPPSSARVFLDIKARSIEARVDHNLSARARLLACCSRRWHVLGVRSGKPKPSAGIEPATC